MDEPSDLYVNAGFEFRVFLARVLSIGRRVRLNCNMHTSHMYLITYTWGHLLSSFVMKGVIGLAEDIVLVVLELHSLVEPVRPLVWGLC